MDFIDKINTKKSEKIISCANIILSDNELVTKLKELYNISQKPIEEIMTKYNTIESIEERREMAERDRDGAAISFNNIIETKLRENNVGFFERGKVTNYIWKKIRESRNNDKKEIEKDEQCQ